MKDQDGNSALIIAAKQPNLAMTRILLDHQADPNQQNEDGLSPLHMAALYAPWKQGSKDIARLLIAQDANMNLQSKLNSTALTIAARNGKTELVSLLVEEGADLNLQGTFYNCLPWENKEILQINTKITKGNYNQIQC